MFKQTDTKTMGPIMVIRPLLLASLTLLMFSLQPSPAFAKAKEATAGQPKNEISARVASNYIALPRLHMAVEVDANRQYRALEIEVWLLPKDEQNLALARSAKKAIMEVLREDMVAYNWEAFEDSKGGPEVAKKVVAASVERACGAKLDEVLIKTLLLK